MEETNFDIRNNQKGEKEFENALRPLSFSVFQRAEIKSLKI